jgi:uncharacterized membrane protein YozB (DUF420 family)
MPRYLFFLHALLAQAKLLMLLYTLCSGILEENGLHDNHRKLSLVNHPALLGYTWDFLKKVNNYKPPV